MMRSHNIVLALALLVCSAGAAHARESKIGFMADLAGGVTIPISDDDYKDFTDASFKLSIKAGAVFYLHPRFGVAAEGQFDWVPVNTNDDKYDDRFVDPRFHRIRLLGGARFIIPFGIGSVYVRAALGLDHLTGSITFHAGGFSQKYDSSSTAFTFEPGFGVQFNVVRHLVVGVYTGFPIQTDQTLRFNVINGVAVSRTFQPIDVDILGVIGFRL
jgi:opacity protein-like surface antigen